MPAELTHAAVKVWDLLVRIGHWLLLALILLSWWSRHGEPSVHEFAGYAAMFVVGARIAWGFIGSRYARFSEFVRSPRTTLTYLASIFSGRGRRYLGHNPLGGWMILALLATIFAVCLSGWLYTTDTYWGVEWVANLHLYLTYLLIGLVLLHLAGVVFSSWRHRENLVVAMFTGKKRTEPNRER
jgi:cytochrome b